ncbi:MAG: methylenetetrahydrofolate reductase [Actinobacteria bacterium]|nr:methylenetetrahydrofolate reductase [Actinomycetota bacterium]
MNKLRDAIDKGKFILTAELGPPKGTDVSNFMNKAEILSSYFDGINITDNQSAVMRLSSLAGCLHLLRAGGTPIMQVTCRDRNRLAIQSDLLGAYSLGIENVLALTGDHPRFGDHPQAKAVYDLDSVQLISVIKSLNEGQDMVGKQLKGATNFIIGAAVSPIAVPLEPELSKFEKKVLSGATFFQTQAVFEPEKMENFMKFARKFNVKIIAGVLILKSVRMVEFINANVPGLDIPESVEVAIRKADDAEEEGIRIAASLVKELRDIVDGVHLMAIGNEHRCVDVLEKAGIV